MDGSKTRQLWIQLWEPMDLAGKPDSGFDELAARYAEPTRHYHNLRHIEECLAEFEPVRQLAQNPIAVELAIWFHDAVYDSRASDNEEHSAEVARTQIEQRTGKPALANSVANLVMATKNHDPSLHPDAPLLVDVDLSILGKPADRFQEYERDIRKEYAWVDPAIFSARRAEILEQFLARPRIFSTKPFSGKYENAARENLQNSIRALRQTA